MTLFCAFTKNRLIRTYGNATVIHPHDAEWEKYHALFPDFAGARNITVLDIDLVTTSCGSGVPEVSVRSRGRKRSRLGTPNMGPESAGVFWKEKKPCQFRRSSTMHSKNDTSA
jgi:hypothetical protein